MNTNLSNQQPQQQNDNLKNDQICNNQKNWKKIYFVFFMFCYVMVFNNYCTGVIPASLVQIQKELGLSYKEQASLGSLEYLGISIGTFIVPQLLSYFSINKVLSTSLWIMAILCLCIYFAKQVIIIYIARFLQGLCQSFFSIYGPVWVNRYGPVDKSATWIGILNCNAPLGVVIGYGCAALLINNFDNLSIWRVSILIQTIMIIISAIVFMFFDNDVLDIMNEEKKKEKDDTTQQDKSNFLSWNYVQNTFNLYKLLLSDKIYILITLAMSITFFEVTGIQYWGTSYLIKYCRASPSKAMSIFLAVTITSPPMGVIFGGYVIDKLGGYRGVNRVSAMKCMFLFALISSILMFPSSVASLPIEFAYLMWFLLFFGACIVPGSGITVDCIPQELHSVGSGLSMLLYNLIGYFFCPILSGIIMDQFENKQEGLVWGWRIFLYIGIIQPIILIYAYMYEQRLQRYSQRINEIEQENIHIQLQNHQKRWRYFSYA